MCLRVLFGVLFARVGIGSFVASELCSHPPTRILTPSESKPTNHPVAPKDPEILSLRHTPTANSITHLLIMSVFLAPARRNHSSGSMSETGSLDRMKAAAERRKKGMDETGPTVSGRVEGTRVNPDSLIDELLKNTKLDQLEESAESECSCLHFFSSIFTKNHYSPRSVRPEIVHCSGWHRFAGQSRGEIAHARRRLPAGGHGESQIVVRRAGVEHQPAAASKLNTFCDHLDRD